MTETLTLQQQQKSRRDLAACALLVCLNLVWLTALTFPFFVADDSYFVTDNTYITGGLSWQTISWAFTTSFPDYWHPLTWLSLALDTTLFAPPPHAWGYHLTNALLHTANALILFAIFRRAFGSTGQALLAAALFSIHPQRVESVAWITERKDVLAAFFGLLAFCTYLRFARQKTGGNTLALCGLFVLSLMAKPLLVMFPFLLLLLDYWPLNRFNRRNFWPLIREKIPLFLLALGGCLNTYLSVVTGGQIRGTFIESIKQAAVNYTLYLRDSFYFNRLCFFARNEASITTPEFLAAALLLLAITLAVVVLARSRLERGKPMLMGWLWFVIAFLPTCGIVQAGFSMRGDRFTYIPAIGLIIAIVFGILPAITWIHQRTVRIAAGSAIVLVLTAFMLQRLWLWHDPLVLMEHDLRIDPDNAYLEQYAGVAAKEKRLPDLAMKHFRRAAVLDPKEFKIDPNATQP